MTPADRDSTRSTQRAVRCLLMRGGTSKGAYFLADDLPADPVLRDQVILSAFGSPDARQIDGVGGAHPLTSKAAIVSRSQRPDADVESSGWVAALAQAGAFATGAKDAPWRDFADAVRDERD